MTLFLNLFLLLLLFNPGSLWGQVVPAPTYLDSNMLIFGNGGGFTIKPLNHLGLPEPGLAADITPTINIINYKGLHVNGHVIRIVPNVEYVSRNIVPKINYDLFDFTNNIDYQVLVASNYRSSYMAINHSSISAFTPQGILGVGADSTDLPTTLYIQSNGGPTWLGTVNGTRATTPSPSVFLYSANRAVGINTDSPTKNLYVSGNIFCTDYILGEVGVAAYKEKDNRLTLENDDVNTENENPHWNILRSTIVLATFNIDLGTDSVTHSIMAIGMGSYEGRWSKIVQRLELFGCPNSSFDDECASLRVSGTSSFELSSEQQNVALTSSIVHTIGPHPHRYYKIRLQALNTIHSSRNGISNQASIGQDDQASISIIGLPSTQASGTYQQLDQLPSLGYNIDVFGASVERSSDTFITTHKLHFGNQSEIRVNPVGDLYFLKGGGSGFAAIKTSYMHATGQIRDLNNILELVSSSNVEVGGGTVTGRQYMLTIGSTVTQNLRFGAAFEDAPPAVISHNIQTFNADRAEGPLTLYSPLNFSDSTLVVDQFGNIGINGEPDPNVKLKVHGDLVATGIISGKYGVINHRDPNLPVSVTLRQGTRWNILVITSMTQLIQRSVVGATHISLFRGTRPPDDFLTRSDNARYRFSTANPWYTFANTLYYKTDTLESRTTFTAQLECDPEPCSDQGQIIILATPSGD